MTRTFIDLSIPIENDVASDPPGLEPKVHYMNHQQTHDQLLGFFPGLEKSDLPEGESWAVRCSSFRRTTTPWMPPGTSTPLRTPCCPTARGPR